MGAAIDDRNLPAKQVGEFDDWLYIVARSEDKKRSRRGDVFNEE